MDRPSDLRRGITTAGKPTEHILHTSNCLSELQAIEARAGRYYNCYSLKMSVDANLFTSPPDKMLRLLQKRLPHSLILFRKLQYLKRTRSDSPLPEIIFTSNRGTFSETSPDPEAFTVAYMNTSGRASTAMYIYSTIEDGRDDGVGEQEYERQLGVITREAMQLRQTLQRDQGKTVPEAVVLGALNTATRRLLEKSSRIKGRPSGIYDNWILDLEKVPNLGSDLPDGMFWDTATLDDCRIVASRTDIPRPPLVSSK